MECSWVIFLAFIVMSFLLIMPHLRKGTSGHRRLPPGPPGWPVFGNTFDLGPMPHRSLAQLRHKYGDVLWLKLGAINTMVILSSKAAAEFFKNHDLSFVERTVTETSRVYGYHKGSVALANYGSYWRVMRRLVTVEMLVNKRIRETAFLRRKCVDDMLLWIEEEAGKANCGVHVARFVFLMTFNLLGNLMLSKDLFGPDSEEGSEFFVAMEGIMEWGGHANMSDIFPWLRRLDPQGLRRKMERDMGKAMKIASKFVKERKNSTDQQYVERERKKDFLDVLLEYEGNGNDEPAKISDDELNIFILEIFLAGSETTSSTIEWALTELIRSPKAMNKAKTELTQVVGPNGKVEESDIEKLPYLQAVIKETLRLHPPIPFLVPRRAKNDTNFMGYFIPKNTQVFVNAWAIGRDPDVWADEPMCFKPERFMVGPNSSTDYKGQHFEFIPFGAGRRMCAGVPLAHRVLHLVLGSLLHHFDWELDASVDVETMDMKDRLGITVRKFEPLLAIPTKCI
ncbi:Cytochrome P450 76A2 [Morus notabilis]|uniref:Cytochrome P450 76A2 n=2 Tax=Morus notabilis TaxID=981085 RepID=W9SZ51_9ROSA|nr:Cytochrome P450 76A2 [Morus notabilis]